MGLDMYLVKKTYLGAHHDVSEIKGNIEVTIKGVSANIDFNRVESITERMGYWRKANQIHHWFVENVQGGEDDCGSYRVSKEQFESLLQDVQTVLAAKGTDGESSVITAFLPPHDGFFFGDILISEWYWDDLEHTREIIQTVLTEIERDEKTSHIWTDYHYQSSW